MKGLRGIFGFNRRNNTNDTKSNEKNNEIYHHRENIFGNFTDYAVKNYIADP
jgi:hypothetical protein